VDFLLGIAVIIKKIFNILFYFWPLAYNLYFFYIQIIPRNQEKIELLKKIKYSPKNEEKKKEVFEFHFDFLLEFFRFYFSFSTLELQGFAEDGLCSVLIRRIQM